MIKPLHPSAIDDVPVAAQRLAQGFGDTGMLITPLKVLTQADPSFEFSP